MKSTYFIDVPAFFWIISCTSQQTDNAHSSANPGESCRAHLESKTKRIAVLAAPRRGVDGAERGAGRWLLAADTSLLEGNVKWLKALETKGTRLFFHLTLKIN